jgi:LysR family glycine cleavage system transcriptional activator
MTIPLPLLHTFLVVARCESMKAAAEKLAVTPGAVSQRIRELEERTGQRMFIRTRSGVALTSAGRKLFARLDPPFRAIESTQAGSRTPRRAKRVVVNTVPSIAISWLIPRLGDFSRRHPDIEIVLETDTRLVDLKTEPVDLVIRHGLGRYPGLKIIWLMAPELIVIASPKLIQTGPPIAAPADCLAYPLLQDPDRQDWPLWFEAHGVTAEGADRGPSFSDDHLLVRAAAAGQGLALVRDIHADEEIRTGRLVRALDISWPTTFAYYLAGTRSSFAKPAARTFAEWLTDEARKSEPRGLEPQRHEDTKE